MEDKASLIEPLIERAQEYGKSSYELLKLRALDKTADMGSALIVLLIILAVLSMFVLIINIGIALWLGDILGKSYYGFAIVGTFYLIIGIVLMFIQPGIKIRVSNSIVKQALS